MENAHVDGNAGGGHDKTVPWYKAHIGEIHKEAQELFENYSGIDPDRVASHILAVVPRRNLGHRTISMPWNLHLPELGLSRSTLYPEMLSRTKFVFDGAPSENLYCTDLHAGLMEAGYNLVLDRPSLRSGLVAADIFDTTPSSPLAQLHGHVDIVYAGSFLHLSDWGPQVAIAKRLVALLRRRKGVLVTGHVRAGAYPLGIDDSGTMFRHDVASFERLWKVVGDETGLTWRVDAVLEDAKPAGFTKAGQWGNLDGGC